MKRTASNPASPPASVHGNGSSVTRCRKWIAGRQCDAYAIDDRGRCALHAAPKRQPKRKWRPEIERDRSMRAYEQNPRALEQHLLSVMADYGSVTFTCNPCECGGSSECERCNA